MIVIEACKLAGRKIVRPVRSEYFSKIWSIGALKNLRKMSPLSPDCAPLAVGAAGRAGVDGAGTTAGCELAAREWPGFDFGPKPKAGGLSVADGAASLETASPASGEKLRAADATAGVRGSSLTEP